jgi:hypothetical protein
MGFVRKTVSIAEDQERWARENGISLSALLQKKLDEQMAGNPQKNFTKPVLQHAVKTFWGVLIVGFAAILAGLMVPLVSGSAILPGILVVVIGTAAVVLGLIEIRYYNSLLAGA